jgi:mono/diheme cytochrome c family protein
VSAATPAATPAAAPAGAAPSPDAYAICSTCHQANGEGLPNTFPPLAGSEYVNGPGAPHIAIVLKGLTGPITVKGKSYNSVMTPWESLSDDQIAAAINYERASWGNTGAPVTSADVAKVRLALKSRTTPWTVDELKKAKL